MPVSISGTTGYAGPLGAITVDTGSIVNNAVTPAKMSRTGTSGQVLTSGGAGADPSYTTLTGYAGPSVQVFTASGTFTVPTGITSLVVTAFGGGGGGAGYNNIGCGSYGAQAGSGGFVKALLTGLTPGASITVTIGGGGNGSAGNVSTGATGGTTSFGSYCTATGGTGGVTTAGTSTWGTNGSGSTTGTFLMKSIPVNANGLAPFNLNPAAGGGYPGGGGYGTGGGGGGAGMSGGGTGGGNTTYGYACGPGANGSAASGTTGGAGGGTAGGSGGASGGTAGGGGGGGTGGVIVEW